MKSTLIKKIVIRTIILFTTWIIVYYGFILPDGRINKNLTATVVAGTDFCLDVLGYNAAVEDNIVKIDGESVVLIADGCNGLELFALYAGFIIIFPGRLDMKLIFIPVGIFIIYIVNVLRETALALNYKFFRESFEINHKYTYVLIVYIIVFLIWRFWLKRYSTITNE